MSLVVDEFHALAKVRARESQRAVLVSGVLRVQPDPDAFILAPLKMAGEGRLWAVAFGRRGEQPTLVSTADARQRDDEREAVIAPLAVALDAYFRECWIKDCAPQVWVSSRSAVAFLDAFAERRVSKDPEVALLGLRLHFLTDRYFYAGQQVLIPTTQALSQHFATGQSGMEDAHLGALLAWIEPPEGQLPEAAARVAEETPAGVATDVAMDAQLGKLLTELAEGQRGKRVPRRAEWIKSHVQETVGSVAADTFHLIERGIAVLERQGLQTVPGMAKLRSSDADAFGFYMKRDFVPLRSSPDYAARQLDDRETAIGAASAIFKGHDLTEIALALEEGEAIEGSFTEFVYGSRAGCVQQAVFETTQFVSKLRLGDTIHVQSPKKILLQLVAQDAPDNNGARRMTFDVLSGKTFVEEYLHEEVTLLPSGGGFFGFHKAPPSSPWILDRRAEAPPQGVRAVPGDPEAQLARLQ